MKKILLSGVKPTGRPHIGNYFGAMKQFVDLQNSGDFDSFVFIADYHALNFIQNADEMRQLTKDLILDYLAIGLDPKRSVLFKQSDISAHTELAWIFDTSAQPSVATQPSLASRPTMIWPGNCLHISVTNCGSFTALVPIIKYCTPAFK